MNKSLSIPSSSDVHHQQKPPSQQQQQSVQQTTTISSLSNTFSNVRYQHLVAGISGGITSTLALHPLDLLKVRLAGLYSSILPLYLGTL